MNDLQPESRPVRRAIAVHPHFAVRRTEAPATRSWMTSSAFAGSPMGPGTLYGALARLERRGFIEALDPVERRRPYQAADRSWRHDARGPVAAPAIIRRDGAGTAGKGRATLIGLLRLYPRTVARTVRRRVRGPPGRTAAVGPSPVRHRPRRARCAPPSPARRSPIGRRPADNCTACQISASSSSGCSSWRPRPSGSTDTGSYRDANMALIPLLGAIALLIVGIARLALLLRPSLVGLARDRIRWRVRRCGLGRHAVDGDPRGDVLRRRRGGRPSERGVARSFPGGSRPPSWSRSVSQRRSSPR